MLNPFPMVNMSGIGGMFVPWLQVAGTLVMHHPMSLPVFLGQIGAERAEYTVAPPILLNLLLANEALPVSMFFSTSDADGDPVTQYQFWDDVNGGGYFRMDGVQQAAGQAIPVSAAASRPRASAAGRSGSSAKRAGSSVSSAPKVAIGRTSQPSATTVKATTTTPVPSGLPCWSASTVKPSGMTNSAPMIATTRPVILAAQGHCFGVGVGIALDLCMHEQGVGQIQPFGLPPGPGVAVAERAHQFDLPFRIGDQPHPQHQPQGVAGHMQRHSLRLRMIDEQRGAEFSAEQRFVAKTEGSDALGNFGD